MVNSYKLHQLQPSEVDEGVDEADDGTEGIEGPACLGCRKRKRKCSRTQPCFYCTKFNLECEYDEMKAKPKLKAGVLQSHSERLDNLEKLFLGQSILLRQLLAPALQNINELATNVAPDIISTAVCNLADDPYGLQLKGFEETLRGLRNDFGFSNRKPSSSEQDHTSQHRSEDDLTPLLSTFHGTRSYLPPEDLISDLVDLHFEFIQPWIPVLHRDTFKAKVRNIAERPRLAVILHAIVVAASRFSKDCRLRNRKIREKLCNACRQYVILQSLESYSVENVQAAIIIAFDSIGAGRGPKSWALVDSMTRTVEHLRLSFEEDEENTNSTGADDDRQSTPSPNQKFMTRMTFLRKADTFIEQEERRRVFWNVFLLDRFCSISTGWNPSLTAVDVRRRLPINGEYWSDNIPHHGETPSTTNGDRSSSVGGCGDEHRPSAREDEVQSLGGFSYCVEASEFLSAVTQFFLHQDVHPQSLAELQEWMNGFKDLDLRLAQWKANLPARWREVRLHPEPKPKFDPLMDQNLTLAHMTHNTSVILLHQFVAYPVAQWQLTSMMRSSQRSSADTCLAAAKEICNMTSRYLNAMDGIVNPQFGFCLFVCGRMLLCHSSFTNTELLPEFSLIIDALGELALRWRGDYYGVGEMDNLFARFQRSLISARTQMRANENEKIDIRAPVYAATSTREMDQAKSLPQSPATSKSQHYATMATFEPSSSSQGIKPNNEMSSERLAPNSTSPPLPISFQADRTMLAPFLSGDLPVYSQVNTRVNSPLAAFGSDTELDVVDAAGNKQSESIGFNIDDLVPWFDDPQFSELDRVWTFVTAD
ncbi:fungal-specific transcription factor domain-containing protein [Myxozyma melibiosi]|uniref:Fungal-specific transcription factor domain-containing protein n=1 Tax=Myxozyma melibiosi TaxID=54550 RepID=A0ABR1EZK6_9ASCO